MKHLFLLLILLVSFTQAQTISVTPMYHSGVYSFLSDSPFLIEGSMEPSIDWEVSISIPLTERIGISPTVYYYNAIYTEPETPGIEFYERFWYISMSIEYTFSEDPLFE